MARTRAGKSPSYLAATRNPKQTVRHRQALPDSQQVESGRKGFAKGAMEFRPVAPFAARCGGWKSNADSRSGMTRGLGDGTTFRKSFPTNQTMPVPASRQVSAPTFAETPWWLVDLPIWQTPPKFGPGAMRIFFQLLMPYYYHSV